VGGTWLIGRLPRQKRVLRATFTAHSLLVLSYSSTTNRSQTANSGVGIQKHSALCDNFLKLCMVFGTDMTFSKTTAHKLRETPSGRYAQNPRWPPVETERAITLLIIKAEPIVIPLF